MEDEKKDEDVAVDTNQTQDDSQTVCDEICNVSITINSETQTYSAKVLQQLPYFEARLSGRWDDSKYQNDTENTKLMNTINVGDDLPFTMKIFDILINIPQTMNIDCDLELKDLSLLLECQSYFAMDVIDKEMILRYFDNSKRITLSDLKQLKKGNDVKSTKTQLKLIVASVNQYFAQMNNEISDYRENKWKQEWLSTHRGNKLLNSNVFGDKTTMIDCFISLTKLTWNETNHSAFIPNFDENLFNKLWKYIVQSKWYTDKRLIKHLSDIARDILDHSQQDNKATTKCYEIHSSQRVWLFAALSDMKYRVRDDETLMLFVKMDVVYVILFKWNWDDAHRFWFGYVSRRLNEKQKCQFISTMIEYHQLHMKTLRIRRSSPGSWVRLFISVIYLMDTSDVIKLIEKWNSQFFELAICVIQDHQKIDVNNENFDWIIDIATKDGTNKEKRKAALLMVTYVTSQAWKPQDIVTDKYIDFVRQALDLKWQKIS